SDAIFVPRCANAEPPTLGEHNGLAIFPMPFFANLQCADLERSRAWYLALGFGDVFSFRAPDGSLTMTHLRRRKYQDLLLVPRAAPADGGPPTLRLVFGADGEVSSLFERARGAPAVGRSAVAEPE